MMTIMNPDDKAGLEAALRLKDHMISVIILTLNDNAVSLDLQVLCIGDNRNIQMLGNLMTRPVWKQPSD